MASNIDYAALRQQALGSGADEEAVTVNTRALIDKVLARYSGEWTTLRELIQNAADASASKVVIKFETLPSPTVPVPQSPDPASGLRHVLLHHTLKRLLVSNNGQPFAPTDWSRLKRIAEGNPDETKIGAFGVGFYSVFADCEEPFVSSGKEAMAFYWKGNALFTRKMQLPEEQANMDTCFVLDYRNTNSPIPGLLSLCQFLSTSLTFVDLEQIELWLDDWNVFSLTKKAASGIPVKIPRDVEPRTKEGIMKLTDVRRQTAQLDAKWMNIVGWIPSSDLDGSSTSALEKPTGVAGAAGPSLRSFFSRLAAGTSSSGSLARKAARQEEDATQKAIAEDLVGFSQASVFLRISTADVRTSVSSSFAQELERATKKPPPKVTRIAILTLSHDETQATLSSKSGVAAQKAADMFASVLPQKSGKIFIGFPTAQTTGFLAHVSAPSVIPTVERENIDLNARMIRTWNCEMLRAAGILCRVAWSSEMSEIQDKITRSVQANGKSKVTREDILRVMDAVIHLFCQFSSQESTPSSRVGQLIEEAFWTCNVNASIDVLSTRGVLPSHEVRIASQDLAFVEGIPVLPEELIQGAKSFIGKLKDFGLLSDITISDIKKELEIKALDGNQLGDFLMWAGKVTMSGEVDRASVRSLLDVALATLDHDVAGGKQGQVLVLGEIKFFINPSKIPAELPVPPTTMPFAFTKNLGRGRVEALGWEELQIVPWVRWLIENTGGRGGLTSEQDITTSPAFTAQILPVVSKQWDLLSQSSKATIKELLASHTVIPTKLGMKKPSDAYFSSVKLFDDLPTVSGLNSVKDKFLLALGVRKTVELGVVFDRLMAAPKLSEGGSTTTEAKWSHVDLIRYLAAIRDDIPPEDIKRLRATPICPAEDRDDSSKPSARKYKISELFEPSDALRSLHLPVLQWPGIFRNSSVEGKFLTFLGLRSFPSVPELVDLMAKSVAEQNFSLRDHALTYYISNHHINGYSRFDVSSIQTPYLPLQGEDAKKLATPIACFSNERAALLGFPILRRDLHSHASKFGVMPDPPMNESVNRLIKEPPRNTRAAREMFSYFSGRLMEMGPNNVQKLSVAQIVPIVSQTAVPNGSISEKAGSTRLVQPRMCFLGDGQTYGEIFDFVDFGTEANMFLLRCGSKHEPSKIELAEMVVREPARLLSVFKSPDKYLDLLRNLAESISSLKKDKALYKEMRHAPFLLAYKEVPAPPTKSNEKNLIDNEPDGLDEEEESGIKEWSLASPSNIIVVDDFISYSLFKDRLLAAPQEEVLEQFYWSLGAPTLSSIVEEEPRIGAVVENQSSSRKLQKQIVERSRLFLHDYSTDMIKHDTRWLEKNLTVKAVRSISLRRTLRYHNLSHTEARTAAITLDQRKMWTLWITASGYDLFQVSQALVNLLLVRPRPHSTMMLEMLLGTDLLKLKARGYNVDRILRAKAVEARIAEDQRQKQLEEERKRIEEQERTWAENERNRRRSFAQHEQEHSVKMPGAFGSDSPEQTKTLGPEDNTSHGLDAESRNRKPKGLFSSLTKQLGFRDGAFSSQNLQNLLSNSNDVEGSNRGPHPQELTPPPPYSSSDPQQQSTKSLVPQPRHPESVTAPHRLHQNLLSAIHASRAHGASDVFSRPHANAIKETASYCDERPGQDITFYADSASGLKIFLSNSMADKSNFLAENSKGLNAFSSVLLDCGDIFALRRDSLHVFYDENGSTIAFNRQGSLFCNYRFFEQLHLSDLQNGGPEMRAEATVYWWVVLCHELAHNLVGDHSADHSYYTESFVMQYFGKVMAKVAQFSVPAARQLSSAEGD
ncbi:HATPase_c domain-containing protein [Xylona heveae TC161]|uniref:HATPase_c domain-containing protein n=1 Tax=Xylona heveae (strain CBS 132557 / TC161) TaxID=1328760 RepID=A0A165FTV5_XYLHT|nr:HATPase_c domain-containing protein [Xylona heveae TC161]KZF21370.1 HATPase_c domain-containing protein [Xylona heveae TC161]